MRLSLNVIFRLFLYSWLLAPASTWADDFSVSLDTTEHIRCLSPDLRLGVRWLLEWDSTGRTMLGGAAQLVKVLDLAEMRFVVLDTLPQLSDHYTFCGKGSLTYLTSEPTAASRYVERWYLRKYVGGDTTILLATSESCDSADCWVKRLSRHTFRLADSLLAYTVRARSDETLLGHIEPMSVVVCRLESNGQVSLITKIENAGEPAFSGDGKQILAQRWNEKAVGNYESTIIVYDLETGSLEELELEGKYNREARRLNEHSPIFYESSNDPRYCYNLRMYDPATGVDSALTNVSPSEDVFLYYVTADSVVYDLYHGVSTPGVLGKSRWKTIRIRQ